MSSLLLLLCQVTTGDLNVKTVTNYKDRGVQKSLPASKLGDLHNTMMLNVHNELMLHSNPSREEYNQMVAKEVVNLCDSSDYVCLGSIKKEVEDVTTQIEAFYEAGDDFDIHSVIPTELNPEVASYLVEIFKASRHLSTYNMTGYTAALDDILPSVRANDNLSEAEKFVIEGVCSIADSSAQFWYEVLTNPESIIYKLDDDRRRLQDSVILNLTNFNMTLNLTLATQADIIGGITAVFPTLLSIILVLFDPLGLASFGPELIKGAVEASLAALGLSVNIPTPNDWVECILSEIFPSWIASIPILGPAFFSFLALPCSTNTLFGSFLGPFVDTFFPPIGWIINDEGDP